MPDGEWESSSLSGIMANLKASGPVANDQTMQTLVLYLDGFLNEQETIARLLPQKLKDQATFKTEKALACLRCTEVITP